MTRKLRIIGKMVPTSLLLSTALAACTVGPDYTAPKTELASFHNAADASSAQGHSAPPLDRWWTGFDDPMLVTVVQRALNENLDLDSALARVRQARATASGAGAQLLPTVDLDASRTYEHQSLNGAFGSVANGSPGFHRDGHEDVIGPSASWEIDLFGGLRREEAAANDEAQAAEAQRAGTRVRRSLPTRPMPTCRSGATRPGSPSPGTRSPPTNISSSWCATVSPVVPRRIGRSLRPRRC
jgi:outer membrane efflux protein